VSANYARMPAGQMRQLPRNLDVAVFHPYVYGVLGELVETFAVRDQSRPLPQHPMWGDVDLQQELNAGFLGRSA
jgi:hypothetical protein